MPILFASLIILAPLYVWRFSIGGLPTNFLMLANFGVVGIGVLMLLREQNWGKIKDSVLNLGQPLLVAFGALGLASLISLFAFGINNEKLAQWVVLYAQPLVIFFLIRYFSAGQSEQQKKWLENFRVAAYVVVGAAGLLALIQYFTLFTLPPAWWGNANEPKRAIAFFAHANAFGLFMTPLLAWLLPDFVQRLQFIVRNKNYFYIALWVLGVVGMFLSLSRGAWIGLIAAAVVYVILNANKKLILGFVAAAVIAAAVVAVVPNLRYRVLLPFYGEKSTVARFSLWDTGAKMLKDDPILGKGINGFSDNWDKYNTDPGLEHYNFPHNIFINFWIDLGLLGLVSMAAIFVVSAWRGLTKWRANRSNAAALGLVLFLVAILVHGLIDIPYLKNDLALIFWIVLALGL